MKEIIKHGFKKYKTTCNRCGCVFTYTKNDIFSDLVDCPECENSICHKLSNAVDENNNYIATTKYVENPGEQTVITPEIDTIKAQKAVLGGTYVVQKTVEVMHPDYVDHLPIYKTGISTGDPIPNELYSSSISVDDGSAKTTIHSDYHPNNASF